MSILYCANTNLNVCASVVSNESMSLLQMQKVKSADSWDADILQPGAALRDSATM